MVYLTGTLVNKFSASDDVSIPLLGLLECDMPKKSLAELTLCLLDKYGWNQFI